MNTLEPIDARSRAQTTARTNEQTNERLTCDFLDFRLHSPLVLASGIIGTSASLMARAARAGAGMVTAKSCGPAPRAGHPNPVALDWGGGLLNAIGLTNGGQFIWLNRFTPSAGSFPIQLQQVAVMFGYPGSTGGVNVGELVDLYFYEDADGNPANGATFKGSLLGQAVQAVNGTTWSTYNLPSAVTFNGPGDILIAVVNRTAGVAAGTFPAVIDQTASQGRSWIGLYSGNPANPPVLPAPTFGTIDSFGFPGNWLVRGYGQGAAPCDNPADVPWLTVSPTGGTTAAGGSTPETVGFNSTGLAAGTYNALLCVTSNDPQRPLVEVPVTLTVGQAGNVVCNTGAITIPSSGAATPYPSTIVVAGQGTSLTDVNVRLLGMNYTWPDDIDILLVSPAGQNIIIMSDAGGSLDLINVDLTFDDAAASTLPDSTQITSGTYKPTNYGTGDTFPAPAPTPSTATQLAIFNGTNPNGTWQLFVVDDLSGDSGNIAGGWCVEISTETPVQPPNINVSPLSLAATQPANTTTQQTLNIGNTGQANLNWAIVEEPAAVLAAVDHGAAMKEQMAAAENALRAPASGTTGSRGGAPDTWAPVRYVSPASFSEGFDDITVLPGQGWFFQNNSSPLGLTNWFQGNSAVFPAHAGAPTAYIAANFNNTAGVGTISNWMLTPVLNLANGDTISFWTRTPAGSIWPDRLELRLSTAGASTNVGSGPLDVGDFTTLLLSVNPTLAVGGYPEAWTQFSATLSGIPAGATGRIAWRYFVTDGGPSGNNSNYIGIDTVEYTSAGPTGPCQSPADMPWLSVVPSNGTTPGGSSTPVTVSFNSTGLAVGTYTANLCVTSNDPDPGPGNGTSLVVVPVTLTVTAPQNAAISLLETVGTTPGVCAATSNITVAPGTTVYYCYTVTNTGNVTLNLHDLTDTVLGTIFSGVNYALTPGSSANTVALGLSIPYVANATTTNTATWTAYNPEAASATASASATVTVTGRDVWGQVFVDENEDGVRQLSENLGVPGVWVTLLQGGSPIAMAITINADGWYQFHNVAPGSYCVRANIRPPYVPTSPTQVCFTVTAGDKMIDFGVRLERAFIGNFVWYDANANGLQDPGEPGIPSVTLALWNSSGGLPGAIIATTTTDLNGAYQFGPVVAGTYFVQVTDALGVLDGLALTTGPQSKPNPYGPITLVDDSNVTDADFGYVLPCPAGNAIIAGLVWNDLNANAS